jgi:hypothetical protein
MDLATLSALAEQLAPLVLQKIKGKGKKEVSELTTVNDYENVKSLPAWYWNKQTGEKKAVNVSMADFQQHVKDVANENLVEIKQEAEEANAAAQNSAESAAASAASAKNSEDYALAQKNETIEYLGTVREDEAERMAAEAIRISNENTRKSNEITRANQENTRIANEEERISNEASRVEVEEARVSAENTRVENELVRETDEQIRQSAERDRSDNEDARLDNEAIRQQNESERQEAESLRDTAESGRVNSEIERDLAEQARIEAENTRIANEEERTTWFTNIKTSVSDWFTSAQNSWAAWFDNVKSLWGTLKSDVENATTLAVEATENANNSANHPPYVGEDLYWYIWNNETKTYDKTDKYSKGDGFSIKMTFASISEMEAYDNSSVILELGDFVLISSDVEDEDNSKLYVVTSVTSSKITFGFLTDMSGARGFTGHTPQLSVGTITTGAAGTLANVSLTENGTDTNGNPKYLINFVIPKGDKGDKGDAFTYDDFTDEQIAGLQKPANDAAAVALSAAKTANDKATLADNAATNANEKAELANTAATKANTAATNANEKAELADTAAGNANEKASLADTAAVNANDKAGLADTAAENANDLASHPNIVLPNGNWGKWNVETQTYDDTGSPSVGSFSYPRFSLLRGHIVFEDKTQPSGNNFRIIRGHLVAICGID